MLSLLLIGDTHAELPQALLESDASLNVARAENLDEAARMLGDAATTPVELVVLADARGGQFGDAALAALRKLAPLARVWRVMGSWCEGEARSGRPPAGCLTTYWHQWPARFGRELETLARGSRPGWALPMTATADERILADAEAQTSGRRAGTIVVIASRAQTAAALADVCRPAGYDTLLGAEDGRFRVVGAKAVLWDTTVERIVDPASVAELRRRAPDAPVLAIVGFPRADDVEQARRAGIEAVISKPYLAGDLLWHVERHRSGGSCRGLTR
jgi:CheY-like chemotaxis protein